MADSHYTHKKQQTEETKAPKKKNPRKAATYTGGYRTKGLESRMAYQIFKSSSITPPTSLSSKNRISADKFLQPDFRLV